MNYTINISIPKTLADLAHSEVKKGHYTSVSEVIRDALRNLLVRQKEIPTYKLTKKMERDYQKAYKEHLEGKSIKINSVKDLLNL
jgi:putative addiction module CopG family antidote